MAGRVRVDGERATKSGHTVRTDSRVEIESGPRFVSRGGEKLEAALHAFALDLRGAEVLDVGASTGGFTDCLLQHGAARVTALDVGYGQLDARLRDDPRVNVVERTNFRSLPGDAFPSRFDAVTIDASFISLRALIPVAARMLRSSGTIVALVKPQFEAGRDAVARGGVVRDPAVHRRILRDVVEAASRAGLVAVGLIASPLYGPAGNREFLLALREKGAAIDEQRIARVAAEEKPA